VIPSSTLTTSWICPGWSLVELLACHTPVGVLEILAPNTASALLDFKYDRSDYLGAIAI